MGTDFVFRWAVVLHYPYVGAWGALVGSVFTLMYAVVVEN